MTPGNESEMAVRRAMVTRAVETGRARTDEFQRVQRAYHALRRRSALQRLAQRQGHALDRWADDGGAL